MMEGTRFPLATVHPTNLLEGSVYHSPVVKVLAPPRRHGPLDHAGPRPFLPSADVQPSALVYLAGTSRYSTSLRQIRRVKQSSFFLLRNIFSSLHGLNKSRALKIVFTGDNGNTGTVPLWIDLTFKNQIWSTYGILEATIPWLGISFFRLRNRGSIDPDEC